jgi:hypothetical protein
MSSSTVPQPQEVSPPTEQHPPTYHEAGSESKPPSYPPSLAPQHLKPRKSQAEMLEEFKEFREMQNDNWGAHKGVVTGPAKDPLALFKWVGRKMSRDQGETSEERKARKYKEWEESQKETEGVGSGDMETTKIM